MSKSARTTARPSPAMSPASFAKALGRKATYFGDIKEAIAFAENLAIEIGLECGVMKDAGAKNPNRRYMVRQGWHQGGGRSVCCYIARLKTIEQYQALGMVR